MKSVAGVPSGISMGLGEQTGLSAARSVLANSTHNTVNIIRFIFCSSFMLASGCLIRERRGGSMGSDRLRRNRTTVRVRKRQVLHGLIRNRDGVSVRARKRQVLRGLIRNRNRLSIGPRKRQVLSRLIVHRYRIAEAVGERQHPRCRAAAVAPGEVRLRCVRRRQSTGESYGIRRCGRGAGFCREFRCPGGGVGQSKPIRGWLGNILALSRELVALGWVPLLLRGRDRPGSKADDGQPCRG